MHVLVAGCGWLGSGVARALLARGDRVTAVRSDPARAAALGKIGAEPLALDLCAPGAPGRLPRDLDAVVACQSASGEGEGAYRRAYVDANRALLAAAADRPVRALVYTGSTGLFGQRDGGDVDEQTPPAPATPAAEMLALGERLVREASGPSLRACVLRLSGLYGPGRIGVVDRVRRGALALGPGDDAWMNFCHLDDAVTAVLAALARGRGGAVYHGTDAEPMRRREVVAFVAGRLGIAPSRSDAPPALAGGSAGANRRVLAGRTRAELELALRWPSLRDGLAPFLPEARG